MPLHLVGQFLLPKLEAPGDVDDQEPGRTTRPLKMAFAAVLASLVFRGMFCWGPAQNHGPGPTSTSCADSDELCPSDLPNLSFMQRSVFLTRAQGGISKDVVIQPAIPEDKLMCKCTAPYNGKGYVCYVQWKWPKLPSMTHAETRPNDWDASGSCAESEECTTIDLWSVANKGQACTAPKEAPTCKCINPGIFQWRKNGFECNDGTETRWCSGGDQQACRIEGEFPLTKNPCRRKDAEDVDVRVFWVRHGYSCAYRKVNPHDYPDPELTDYAINYAKGLNGKLLELAKNASAFMADDPMIFSSPMVRSMETALYNFPGSRVYVIPWIAETGDNVENTPLSWDEQLSRRLKPNDVDVNNLNVTFALTKDRDDPDSKDNYQKFLGNFPEVLRRIRADQGKPLKPGDVISVIIVSHPTFMADNLKQQCSSWGKPKSNDMWGMNYRMSAAPDQNWLRVHGVCPLYFEAKSVPKWIDSPNFKRCEYKGQI